MTTIQVEKLKIIKANKRLVNIKWSKEKDRRDCLTNYLNLIVSDQVIAMDHHHLISNDHHDHLVPQSTNSTPSSTETLAPTRTLVCRSCRISLESERPRSMCPFCGTFYNEAAEDDYNLRSRGLHQLDDSFDSEDNLRLPRLVS